MTVQQRHQAGGSWSLTLSDSTPQSVLDVLDEGGHVAVLPGPYRSALDDQLLDAARYVGVVLQPVRGSSRTLAGQGLAWWLGDHQGIGPVFETAVDVDGDLFATGLRSLIAVHDVVVEGTFHSITGAPTGVGQFRWVTLRQALDRWCGQFDADWTLRADATDGIVLDAGEPDDLFTVDPDAVVVAHGARDIDLQTLPPRRLDVTADLFDWNSRAVLLPAGLGDNVADAAGAADIGANPYTDLRGNAAQRTRVAAESDTAVGDASTRAQLLLNRYSTLRRAVTLSTAGYDLAGTVEVGGWIWVYDPHNGLYDTSQAKRLGGDRIAPVKLRVQALTWPVEDGMGVYYRASDGTWTDLTEHVQFESGDTVVDVGAAPRSLTQQTEPVGLRVNTDPDDGRTPATPSFVTPFQGYNYLSTEGQTRTAVVVEWSTPILNDDASAVTDGDRVEVQLRQTGAGATDWQTFAAPWGDSTITLYGLDPGTDYQVRASAIDIHGNRSAWSAAESFTALADTTPPSQPAAPSTVAGSPLRVQVVHDLGKATGGTFNLETDLDHLDVHVGTTSGFAVDSSNKVGELAANAGMLSLGISAVGDFEADGGVARYVKVVAVDRAGNASDASAAASVTAQLVDTAHIANAAISTAKIGDAQITTAKIGDLQVTTAKIALLAVDTAQIANAAIENAKIADLAVTNAKIANATIQSAKISDLAASKITAGTISGEEIILSNSTASILRSSNYVGGSAGWRIRGNGDAEFNNVTVRGAVYASSGELGTLDITGTLEMQAGTILRLKSGAQYKIELGPNSTFGSGFASLKFWNGSSVLAFELGVNTAQQLELESKAGGDVLVDADVNIVHDLTVQGNITSDLTFASNRDIQLDATGELRFLGTNSNYRIHNDSGRGRLKFYYGWFTQAIGADVGLAVGNIGSTETGVNYVRVVDDGNTVWRDIHADNFVNEASERNLKRDFAPTDRAVLDVLKAAPPERFRFRADAPVTQADKDHMTVGPMVDTLPPDIVREGRVGDRTTRGISLSRMAGHLWAFAYEHDRIIEDLEARIDALESA